MAKSPINYDKPYEISVSTNSETGERTTTFRQGSNYLSVEDKDPSIAPATPPGEEFSLGPSPLRQRLDERAAAASTGQPLEYQKAAPAVSPNEETPPEITVETAQAAVETAQQAAASISPSQEPGTSVTATAAGVEQPTQTLEQQFDAEFGTAQSRELQFSSNGVAKPVNSEIETKNFSATRTGRKSFNISTFRTEVTEIDGVLPTHSFLVRFAPMDWMKLFPSADRNSIDEMLTMRCDNVILPSINLLQEQNIRRYGFGPVENVAYGVNVGDFSLQFIVDRNAWVVDFFEAWMNKIVNRDSYGGANMNADVGNNRTPYEVAYKDSYACSSVNVFIYDRAQNTVMEYNIYDVFPTGIQSMNMSWSEENTMMRLNITFSFTDLRIRPKASLFGQSAAEAPSAPVPDVITKMMEAGDKPLVDRNAVFSIHEQANIDLSNLPVVIGDGPNGALRTYGTPEDTAPFGTNTPEISPPTTRNAFGQPEIIA